MNLGPLHRLASSRAVPTNARSHPGTNGRGSRLIGRAMEVPMDRRSFLAFLIGGVVAAVAGQAAVASPAVSEEPMPADAGPVEEFAKKGGGGKGRGGGWKGRGWRGRGRHRGW